jgi:hypothetical protein
MKNIFKRINNYCNPKKYVQVDNVEDYFNTPFNQRVKWGFWYLKPRGLSVSRARDILASFDELDKRLAKEFPIQFYLRETCDSIYSNVRRFINDFKSKIRCLFRPYHSSIRKAVPREWQDLDAIITNVLYAALVSFVEEEDGLETLRRLREADKKNKDDKEFFEREWGSFELFESCYDKAYSRLFLIEHIYKWIKEGRAVAENYMNEELKKCGGNYEKYNKLEKGFIDTETRYLVDIVKLRGNLWT